MRLSELAKTEQSMKWFIVGENCATTSESREAAGDDVVIVERSPCYAKPGRQPSVADHHRPELCTGQDAPDPSCNGFYEDSHS